MSAVAQTTGADRPARARFIAPYVGLLCLAAGLMVATADPAAIVERPILFVVLVAATIGLDRLNLDLFDRGKTSPAGVPTIALACLFGPLGPVAAELIVACERLAHREAPVKIGFDLAALSLAGGAAAVLFGLVADPGTNWAIVAATMAGAAYYAVNGAALVGVWTLDEDVSPLAAWSERFRWAGPHYLVYGLFAGLLVAGEVRFGSLALVAFGAPVAVLWLAQKQYLDRSRDSVTELRRNHEELRQSYERQRALLEENRDLLERMERAYIATVTSLARAIEARDPYTGGHTERVAEFAVRLAHELDYAGKDLWAVEVGGAVHDVGKIGIPDGILQKPGQLTDAEFGVMKSHTEISSYILDGLEIPEMVKQMARHHHERYDGRGYPDGLAGEGIPLVARILTVADALDAMTSDRPYRAALSWSEALEELQRGAGGQFCPRVVAALTASYGQDPTFWLGAGYQQAPRALAAA